VGLPVVAVVGRPNVGKSTLVNRLLGRREAIVEEHPGVTRDRKTVEAEWRGRRFVLVDTGGWLAIDDSRDPKVDLDAKVSEQAERAIASADAVLLVVDVTVGITDDDDRVAALLRAADPARVLVVVNKVDNEARESDAWGFAGLGLGLPFPVSALQGRGAGDLLDALVARLPEAPDGSPAAVAGSDAGEAVPAVAIVGRPNVGKSTLFNRLIGEERAIVHDLPGTTRDAIDTVVSTADGPIRFVDTAGMRRKSRVGDGAEYYSLVRALQAIDRADVALLLIDSAEGVTHQDQRLAERVDAAGSPVVIVLNKWDLLDAEQRAAVSAQLEERLHFLGYAPTLKTSARSGKGVHKVLPAVRDAMAAYRMRVPTRELNRVVQAAQAEHPASTGRVLYATQGATDPPTFTLFSNRPLPAPYLRYLERRIREHFGFGPTPLKLRVRRRAG
jgi:GTP-binding protein